MSKRKQVKNACVNCQKACKKCDDGRPCERCTKYGLENTCRDSARKERRRSSKRNTGLAKFGEESETDYSDEISSVAPSEDPKTDSAGNNNNISFRFKISETVPLKKRLMARPALDQNNGSYWNVDFAHSDRPIRAARQRSITYDEGRLAPISSEPSSPRPPLQIGASDASYIKALGMVCTDTLRKIEEEDLPPAVVYQEWPPKVDLHFEHVAFTPYIPPSFMIRDGHGTVSLMQPSPMQRILLPEILNINIEAQPVWPLTNPPSSSSPADSDSIHLGIKHKSEIMTPPETPINIPNEPKRPAVDQALSEF